MMNNAIDKYVISILVDNQANVLTRIASLFGRRGFNIDSLTVSTTNNPSFSRITVVFTGTEQGLHQIVSQTYKSEVVKSVFVLDKKKSIYRELLLLKVRAGKEERSAIKEIVEIFRGKIVDLSKESLVVEMTGASEKIDGFMDMMSCYEILEVCRTGITGISKSSHAWDDDMNEEELRPLVTPVDSVY